MQRRKFLTSIGSVGLGATHSLRAFAAFLDREHAFYSHRPKARDEGIPGDSRIKEIPVRGGRYKVWTKRIGSGPIKVLLLHGGPGLSHEYLEGFESFLPNAGIEFYYYDQLGCNNSDRPTDPSLWTLEGYLEEVEEVRQGLGLQEFVLYGHSWGGILAIEYALKYSDHLRGLVISNMSAGMTSYTKRINWWRRQFPKSIQEQLDRFDLTANYDSPEYAAFMMREIYPRVICRLPHWPEPVLRTLQHMNEQIYVQMQGRSEFQMTGNLKDWDRWAELKNITTRTLTIGSQYDEMDPKDLERMATMIPKATYAFCPHGSHLCMWDDKKVYFDHLTTFLKSL